MGTRPTEGHRIGELVHYLTGCDRSGATEAVAHSLTSSPSSTDGLRVAAEAIIDLRQSPAQSLRVARYLSSDRPFSPIEAEEVGAASTGRDRFDVRNRLVRHPSSRRWDRSPRATREGMASAG